MNEYREAHEEARKAGLEQRHRFRLEMAVRREVADEIAAEADRIAAEYAASAEVHRNLSDRTTPKGQRHWRTALAFHNKADGAYAVAHAAREIGARNG